MKKLNFGNLKREFAELRPFLLLWSTQAFSSLGTSMTGFALIIWSYQQCGSALTTALLSVCSYGPYVAMSIFAGALTDRWDKRRTMLLSDAFAAVSTLTVLFLLETNRLQIGHLYLLNGLMNTIHQPASTVAVTLLVPERHYQRVGGLQALSSALVTVLTPVIASVVLAFAGLETVIWFDLCTCGVALSALGLWIRIPEAGEKPAPEPVLRAAREGIRWLWQNRGILDLMLFLAAINFAASLFEAALPAMLLSRKGGGETALGLVNAFTGLATLVGSIAASLCPAPKSRVRVIQNALMLSMTTENLIIALGRSAPAWCFAAVLGWIAIPVMNANLNALYRLHIPVEMQGRVYSARNTLQFFTIPLGYLLGGVLVDEVFEPFMSMQGAQSLLVRLLGGGKGSGAALLLLVLAAVGALICLVFRWDRHIWALEAKK